MKILIINTFYTPKLVGGAEVSVQILAEELAGQGHKVYVLTSGKLNKTGHLNGVVVIRVKQLNVYSTYNGTRRMGLLKALWHLVDSCNFLTGMLLSGILKKLKPDLVHTNNIQGFSPFVWKVVKRNNIPLVHTLRDYYLVCHKGAMYSNNSLCKTPCSACRTTYNIKKRFGHYPDYYVGVSRFILEKHREYYPMDRQQTGAIYNSIDRPKLVPGARLPGKITYGFIGRISQAKGVAYMSRELGKMPAYLKERTRVLFAGTVEEAYARQLETNLAGLEHKFLGRVNAADFYNSIDVLIVPSLWNEPFPRVAIEALSYSVPVCLAETGGLPEVYHPACTWKFSPSEGTLTELIAHLSGHPGEIESKKEACAAYAKNFSRKQLIDNYMQVYMQAIEISPEPAASAAGPF